MAPNQKKPKCPPPDGTTNVVAPCQNQRSTTKASKLRGHRQGDGAPYRTVPPEEPGDCSYMKFQERERKQTEPGGHQRLGRGRS
jgi:hypothetical protein